MACASSRMATSQSAETSAGLRSSMPYVVMIRSASSPCSSCADGCSTRVRSVGENRAISALQFPSSDAGATSKLGPLACPALLRPRRKARTCKVFPRPMSSARHVPRPSPAANESHRTPTSWYGRSSARSSEPGRSFPNPSGLRRPARASASQGPALTRDQSATSGSSGAAASPSAPARSRIASRREIPPLRAARCAFFQCARTCSSLSRSISTQRPRTSASPWSCAASALHSFSLKGSPSSASWTSKSTSASSPSPVGLRPPSPTSTPRRERFFHQSGTRTTMPAASKAGTSRKNRSASPGVQASVRNNLPSSTSSLARTLFSEARCTGSRRDRRAPLSEAKSRTACPSGRCCGWALLDRRVV